MAWTSVWLCVREWARKRIVSVWVRARAKMDDEKSDTVWYYNVCTVINMKKKRRSSTRFFSRRFSFPLFISRRGASVRIGCEVFFRALRHSPPRVSCTYEVRICCLPVNGSVQLIRSHTIITELNICILKLLTNFLKWIEWQRWKKIFTDREWWADDEWRREERKHYQRRYDGSLVITRTKT